MPVQGAHIHRFLGASDCEGEGGLMTDEFYTGVVVTWFEPRGFGFIARDDGEHDAFVNIRDCLTEYDS